MKWMMKLSVMLVAAGLFAIAGNSSNDVCAGCHEQAKKLGSSAHAGLSCNQCHPGHEEFPHAAGIPKPKCATCHTKQGDDYAKGVHGQAVAQGNQAAPDCSTCHNSAHEVLR